jgi:hypothetical protein
VPVYYFVVSSEWLSLNSSTLLAGRNKMLPTPAYVATGGFRFPHVFKNGPLNYSVSGRFKFECLGLLDIALPGNGGRIVITWNFTEHAKNFESLDNNLHRAVLSKGTL